jgi:hypothetical protein
LALTTDRTGVIKRDSPGNRLRPARFTDDRHDLIQSPFATLRPNCPERFISSILC